MSGERDIESLSVVTYEKAKFRAPSNRRSRFESGLQPNLASDHVIVRIACLIVCYKTKTNVITKVSQGANWNY